MPSPGVVHCQIAARVAVRTEQSGWDPGSARARSHEQIGRSRPRATRPSPATPDPQTSSGHVGRSSCCTTWTVCQGRRRRAQRSLDEPGPLGSHGRALARERRPACAALVGDRVFGRALICELRPANTSVVGTRRSRQRCECDIDIGALGSGFGQRQEVIPPMSSTSHGDNARLLRVLASDNAPSGGRQVAPRAGTCRGRDPSDVDAAATRPQWLAVEIESAESRPCCNI
jgi:hypothetical protein